MRASERGVQYSMHADVRVPQREGVHPPAVGGDELIMAFRRDHVKFAFVLATTLRLARSDTAEGQR